MTTIVPCSLHRLRHATSHSVVVQNSVTIRVSESLSERHQCRVRLKHIEVHEGGPLVKHFMGGEKLTIPQQLQWKLLQQPLRFPVTQFLLLIPQRLQLPQ